MRQIILLVILIIVAAFAYLYFFTGLIKSHEEAPPPPPAVAIKQPIPPRPEQSGAAQSAPVDPAPTAVPVKADAPSVKPSPTPVKPVAAPAPAQKPAPMKAQPVPAKPAAVARSATPPAKPASAPVKAAVPVKPTSKTAAVEKLQPKKEPAKHATEKSAVKKTAGHYTLAVGSYVLEKSVAADKAKLKKAGLAAVVKKGEAKQEPMTRLYLGTFTNYDEAAAALKKLRRSTADGFFVPEGDRYAVYAGSYFLEKRAALEQDRLSGKGIRSVLTKVKVPVPTYRMTAGSFSTREDAVQAAARLKKLGIRAAVVRLK